MVLNSIAVNVGEKVRSARVRRGMSLGNLAKASGLSKGFISQVEHGRSQPSLDSLGRIAASLELSLQSLLDGHERVDADRMEAYPSELFRLRPPRDVKTGVETLLSSSTGALVVAYLAPGASLAPAVHAGIAGAGEAGQSRPVHALCVVIDGAAVFVQDGIERLLTQGDALAWDAARSYRFRNREAAVCALLIDIGPEGEVPIANPPQQASARAVENSAAASPLKPVEGPLRLVAMRAHRRGTGK